MIEGDGRKRVCVQGLGFVGSAMSVAVASATDEYDKPLYDVVGIDLPNENGRRIVNSINNGVFPFENSDTKLTEALREAHERGNLHASTDAAMFSKADIVVVDINLDVQYGSDGSPSLDLSVFKRAMRTLGERIQPRTLVIVETTVPPGTCEKVVVPILTETFAERGLNEDDVLVAHSYERVMPGEHYLDSIINYWRVYSGATEEAARKCGDFLGSIINTNDYPLTRLERTTASETAKVLENSYRATTIAFMEEWGRFAEAVGIDMFEIVDAIRMRPTHSNMRTPGFGVGGYCLTKDPFFTPLAAKELFALDDLEFPFSTNAVRMNNAMPLVSLGKVERMLGGSLSGKKLLACGVSYRQDVGDTRYSPTEIFVRAAEEKGATVDCQDPLVARWPEMDRGILDEVPDMSPYDAVLLAVPHRQYGEEAFTEALVEAGVPVFDSNNVLSKKQRMKLESADIALVCIGR